MREDSRDGDSREVNRRVEGSQEEDCREDSRGLGAQPDLHFGATFRTGATEGKHASSSTMTRVFSRGARVQPNSRKI